MENFIDFFLILFHNLKYSKYLNRNISFESKIEKSCLIEGEISVILFNKVIEEYSILIDKGNGIPTYVYFQHQQGSWYNVFVVNKEKKFHCRLSNLKIEDINSLPNDFYIKWR